MYFAWLASVFLRLLGPPRHGVLEFFVDAFAARQRRQLWRIFAGRQRQQLELLVVDPQRGLAGAFLCVDRSPWLDSVAVNRGPVADPFGCVCGSSLWRQSSATEEAHFGGWRRLAASSVGVWQ